MAQASKTFRIFVSSTFNDLKEERDALQKEVFPKLRELCRQHGCRFQAIDLRWGVREEAGLDQQTMTICLDEITRCQKTTPRPNFIVLLGDRYGWRPLPVEISAGEFEEILHYLPTEEMEQERQRALLEQWYRRDDNAVPPVYCLQPREGVFRDLAAWEAVERELRAILLGAIDEMTLTPEQRMKYLTSATEQEIAQAVLHIPEAPEHVFGFFRTINHRPQDPSAKDFLDLVEMDGAYQPDTKVQAYLKRLKDHLRGRLPGHVYGYMAEWTGSGITTDHIPNLCTDVYQSLSHIIKEEIAQLEEVDPLEKEIEDHATFGKERMKFFTGRTGILQTLDDYVKGENRHPLAVFGASGSGKSALIAQAVEQARSNYPHAVIIQRFIGATPGSSDGLALLASLCRQTSHCYGVDDATLPADYKGLIEEFSQRLALAKAEKPLIVFVDALDQLSDVEHARNLIWLPTELPEHVRLIVSTLPSDCLLVLERKLPTTNLVELELMPAAEGYELLDLWLQDAGRTLRDHQHAEVLSKFAGCGLPLYLKLAFEEARRWKSYTDANETILGQDTPGVIRDLFVRLSSDANHGELLVAHSLGYLAAAKNGLSEDELLDVLSLDEEVFQDFLQRARHELPQRRLPVVVWSRLYFDLEPYLIERSTDGTALLTFYHRQLGEVVAESYLAGEAKRERHHELARYFENQALQIERDGKKICNIRKVSELPYQQTHGKMWLALEQTLCDLRFIEVKCALEMTYELVGDYVAALDALPEAQEENQREREREERLARYTQELIAYAKAWNHARKRHAIDPKHHPLPKPEDIPLPGLLPSIRPRTDEEIKADTERVLNNPTRLDRIRAFSQFVNAECHNLIKYGGRLGFCVQQAYNLMADGPVGKAADLLIHGQEFGESVLLRYQSSRPRYTPYPALLRTLEGHTSEITTVAVTADSRRAVSGSYDDTLRVWDIESGQCMHILQGHSSVVYAVAVTADGRQAVSISLDCTLRIWEIESGQCLQIIECHSAGKALALTPDGRRAVSSGFLGENDRLWVWDLESGQYLPTLLGHYNEVTALAVTADGRRAVSVSRSLHGNAEDTLRVWDIQSGRCLHTLEGHPGGGETVALCADGQLAISAGDEGMLRVWDIKNGQCLRVFQHPRGLVSTLAVTADGQLVVSASGTFLGGWDNVLRVWDMETGQCVKTLWGHAGRITTVALTVDGRWAISGGQDNTLRVWDIQSGQGLRTLEGDSGKVKAWVLTANGQRVVLGRDNNAVHAWDVPNSQPHDAPERHSDRMQIVSLTADSRRAISRIDKETLVIWDIESGQHLHIFKHPWGSVYSVAITADGRRAISGWDHKLQVWDIESGQCLYSLEGHKSYHNVTLYITAVAVTADGRRAISGSDDRTLRVWDIESGRCLQTLQGHSQGIRAVAVTADGRRAISDAGSDDRTLRVWDIESGRCLQTLQGHSQGIRAVAVTADGRRAVSVSDDYTLRVWDIESGRCLQTINYYPSEKALPLLSSVVLALTSDGRRAVLGVHTTLGVWDIESGQCLVLSDQKLEICSLALRDSLLLVNDSAGNDLVFEVQNLNFGPPLITLVHVYNFGEKVWEKQVTAQCEWCGQRFIASPIVLEAVSDINLNAKISPDQSPCMALPAEAWDEPRLLSECPHCHNPLRFNPFIVDNRGWTPTKAVERVPAGSVFVSTPHPAAAPERASRLNIQYQNDLAWWKALPLWRRLIVKRPKPPTGI